MEKEPDSQALPYASYGTFLTTLDHYKAVGIPNLIDRNTLPPTLSGSSRYEVLGTLKFFGLVGEGGRPNPILMERVIGSERREAMTSLLRQHFNNLFDLPLATAGPTEVNKWFSDHATPSTASRAKAFFLSAAKQNGITLHPLVAKGTRAVTGSIKRKRRKAKPLGAAQEASTNGTSVEQLVPTESGETRTVKLRSGGTVTVGISVNLWDLDPGEDRDLLFDLIDRLKRYEKAGSPGAPRATANGAAES